jgi:hypothetical protein
MRLIANDSIQLTQVSPKKHYKPVLQSKTVEPTSFCYQQPLSTCCTNGPTFYVKPLTAEVKNGSLVNFTATASQTYWDLTYTSSVASTSSTLSAQSTTSAATASSYTSATGYPSSTSSTTSSPETSSGLSPGAIAGIGVGVCCCCGRPGLAWVASCAAAAPK